MLLVKTGVEAAFVLKYWILMQFAKWDTLSRAGDVFIGIHWIDTFVFSHG